MYRLPSRHDLSKKTYKVNADITFNNITCELFYNVYMSTKMHLNNMRKICPIKKLQMKQNNKVV